MGKFEDLLDLLVADDDDEDDVAVEIHMFEDGPKVEPEEEPKGKHESKPSEDEDSEVLREKAVKQHKEIIKEFGQEKADDLVNYAAACATITALVRENIPLDQKMVDEYNALCEKIYPEHCTPFAKKIMYMALHEMIEEGKRALG